MYNIFTVLNEGYAKFGILFVYSILDRLDLDKIENIFLYDTGLSPETRKKLQISSKVKIIESGLITAPDGKVHDESWQENVYSKAKLLKHCIQNQETFLPTIMVDADCIFVQDFIDLIDTEKDAILCKRSMRGRKQGHQATSSHIGSFFAVNNRDESRVVKFLDYWIDQISKMPERDERTGAYTPKESPALSKAYEDLNDQLDLADLPEPIVANIEMTPPSDAKIYHLKSDFRFLTIDRRINQPRAAFYANRYLL